MDTGLSPVLKDIVDIADKLVGILAILVGGLFAYFKFFKERVYRPRLEPQVSAELLGDPRQRFLRVVGGVKNTGLAKVNIDLEPSCLRIFGAERLPERADEPEWTRIATLDISDRHEWVESQEMLRQTWLVALPQGSTFPAYRVELRLVGEISEWYGEAVVVPRTPAQASAASEEENNHGA
jgi:hypothetical protein